MDLFDQTRNSTPKEDIGGFYGVAVQLRKLRGLWKGKLTSLTCPRILKPSFVTNGYQLYPGSGKLQFASVVINSQITWHQLTSHYYMAHGNTLIG